MKKFGKFLVTTFSLAAILGGAYYFYQNVFKKSEEQEEEFEDFDDFNDFDDFDDTDKNSSSKKSNSKRGYTTLDIDAMKADKEADPNADQDVDHDNVEVFDLNEEDNN